MYESEEDLRRLQLLLDRTLDRANPHLASIVSPEGVTFMVVEPTSMWAYAFRPNQLPGELPS